MSHQATRTASRVILGTVVVGLLAFASALLAQPAPAQPPANGLTLPAGFEGLASSGALGVLLSVLWSRDRDARRESDLATKEAIAAVRRENEETRKTLAEAAAQLAVIERILDSRPCLYSSNTCDEHGHPHRRRRTDGDE